MSSVGDAGVREEDLTHGPEPDDPPALEQDGAAAEAGEASTDTPPLEITFKMVPAATAWQMLSPRENMHLLGFLCESDLLGEELGKVECESITVRDEFSSGEQQEEHYESILGRDRSDSQGFLDGGRSYKVAAISAIMVALLLGGAVVIRKKRRTHRQRNYFSRKSKTNKPGVRYYQKVLHVDNDDVLSVEGEDSYGQVHSPGSFAGDFTSDDDRGFGRDAPRRPSGGFREAASNIVARVLSGGADQRPVSPTQV
ncbi:unnamed protein product [Ectocarpus sp. 12 AP-2014]